MSSECGTDNHAWTKNGRYVRQDGTAVQRKRCSRCNATETEEFPPESRAGGPERIDRPTQVEVFWQHLVDRAVEVGLPSALKQAASKTHVSRSTASRWVARVVNDAGGVLPAALGRADGKARLVLGALPFYSRRSQPKGALDDPRSDLRGSSVGLAARRQSIWEALSDARAVAAVATGRRFPDWIGHGLLGRYQALLGGALFVGPREGNPGWVVEALGREAESEEVGVRLGDFVRAHGIDITPIKTPDEIWPRLIARPLMAQQIRSRIALESDLGMATTQEAEAWLRSWLQELFRRRPPDQLISDLDQVGCKYQALALKEAGVRTESGEEKDPEPREEKDSEEGEEKDPDRYVYYTIGLAADRVEAVVATRYGPIGWACVPATAGQQSEAEREEVPFYWIGRFRGTQVGPFTTTRLALPFIPSPGAQQTVELSRWGSSCDIPALAWIHQAAGVTQAKATDPDAQLSLL